MDTTQKSRPSNSNLGNIESELADKHYFNLQSNRYSWVVESVKANCKKGMRVADVGSAPGHLAAILADAGFEVAAFDFAPDVDMWEQTADGSFSDRLKSRGIKIRHWDFEVEDPKQAFELEEAETFDCVIFTEVLEHIYRYPFATLSRVVKLLKPGGTLIVTTPNRSSFPNRVRSVFGRPIDTRLELLMDNFPPHMRHVWLYTPAEVKFMLEKTGISVNSTEVKCFHLWTTPIANQDILPYWRPTSLKQLFKPAYAVLTAIMPNMADTICCIGKKG